VSGMKPMRRSVFSGASEPAAQAALRRKAGAARLRPATAMDCLRKVRRVESHSFMEELPFRAIKNGATPGALRRGERQPGGRRCPRFAARRRWRAAKFSLNEAKVLPSVLRRIKPFKYSCLPT